MVIIIAISSVAIHIIVTCVILRDWQGIAKSTWKQWQWYLQLFNCSYTVPKNKCHTRMMQNHTSTK